MHHLCPRCWHFTDENWVSRRALTVCYDGTKVGGADLTLIMSSHSMPPAVPVPPMMAARSRAWSSGAKNGFERWTTIPSRCRWICPQMVNGAPAS